MKDWVEEKDYEEVWATTPSPDSTTAGLSERISFYNDVRVVMSDVAVNIDNISKQVKHRPAAQE